jgi:hypothetical protein
MMQAGSLAGHFSAARMASYLRYARDEDDALALYRWNIGASGALFEVLSIVEVGLRNAMDRELRFWNAAQPAFNNVRYTEEWIKEPARPLFRLLNRRTRAGVVQSTYAAASSRARKDTDLRLPGHPRHAARVTHDDVLAHMMFGTWAYLLPDPRHAPGAGANAHGRQIYGAQITLWNQALHRAFPGQGNPHTVFVWVDRLHAARNRTAHHEPLFEADLMGLHRAATRLLTTIDPWLGSWCAGVSRIPDLARTRPAMTP